MSIISAFYGIVIRMYYNEGVHQLPHFHVRVGAEKPRSHLTEPF